MYLGGSDPAYVGWRPFGPRGSLSDAFHGGAVVVEATSSATVRAFYPGELTSTLEPADRIADLLAAANASRRFFNAAKRRVLGFDDVDDADRTFAKFSVPALELRRMLAEARRDEGKPFDLTYARNGTRVSVAFRADGDVASCRVAAGRRGATCGPDELALLPPPPAWATRLLVYLPYPVLDDGDDELVCFGP